MQYEWPDLDWFGALDKAVTYTDDEAARSCAFKTAQAYANRLGILEGLTAAAGLYKKWSSATENLIIDAFNRNPHGRHQIAVDASGMADNSYTVRGGPMRLTNITLADRLMHEPVDFAIWTLPKHFSFKGNDLYSNLWILLAGSLKTVARATVRDHRFHEGYPCPLAAINRFYPLFRFFACHHQSPLSGSLRKYARSRDTSEAETLTFVDLRCDRVRYFHCSSFGSLLKAAEEAGIIARILRKLADNDFRNTFKKLIDESLEQGDSWLHRFAKGEKQILSYVFDPASNMFTGHPDSVIKHSTNEWARQWMVDRSDKVSEVIRSPHTHCQLMYVSMCCYN